MTPDDLKKALEQTFEDRRLTRGERSALRHLLEEAAADGSLRGLLRKHAFALAHATMPTDVARSALGWLEEVVSLLVQEVERAEASLAEAHFTPGDACRNRIAALIASARTSLEVCVFTITDDRITDALVSANERGVRVRVITDNEKAFDPGSDVHRLVTAKVPVRVDESDHHMHHKFAIVDGRTLMNGSYNWTIGAARHNEENLMVVDDPRLVRAYRAAFEKLWESIA